GRRRARRCVSPGPCRRGGRAVNRRLGAGPYGKAGCVAWAGAQAKAGAGQAEPSYPRPLTARVLATALHRELHACRTPVPALAPRSPAAIREGAGPAGGQSASSVAALAGAPG